MIGVPLTPTEAVATVRRQVAAFEAAGLTHEAAVLAAAMTLRIESHKITLREYTDQVWHCYLPEARPGMLYGYRAYGPRPTDPVGRPVMNRPLMIVAIAIGVCAVLPTLAAIAQAALPLLTGVLLLFGIIALLT